MSQDLLFGFPIPVVLALAALIAILLGLARVLVSLGRPPTLHSPGDGQRHEFSRSAGLEHQPH